jgi:XRE family transcriptional regulator, regulator of sulfur utilization
MPRADHRKEPVPELRRLGAAVRELREARDLKQIEVAHVAKVSESRVSEIESGLSDARWTTVEKMLRGLGVSLTELAEALERQPR